MTDTLVINEHASLLDRRMREQNFRLIAQPTEVGWLVTIQRTVVPREDWTADAPTMHEAFHKAAVAAGLMEGLVPK